MREGNHYGRLETGLGLSGKASWGCGNLKPHNQREKKIQHGLMFRTEIWHQFVRINDAGLAAGLPGKEMLKTQTLGLRACFWTRGMMEKLAWMYYCTIGQHCQYEPDGSSSESVTTGRDQITSTNGTLLSSFSQDAKGWLGMKGGRWTVLKRSLPSCWHCVILYPAVKLLLGQSKWNSGIINLNPVFLQRSKEPEAWPRKSTYSNCFLSACGVVSVLCRWSFTWIWPISVIY